MTTPYDVLFGGMQKLGPGSDKDTLHVLTQLPPGPRISVVDAGCGTGRQTLALAEELQTVIHALDIHQSFLDQLDERATDRGIGHLIKTHMLDIGKLAEHFSGIDLLWAEGSAYNIGFASALERWAPALSPTGVLVVSELCWLSDNPPESVRHFFASGYPGMKSVAGNLSVINELGYSLHASHTLPTATWQEGYYEVLQPRAEALANDANQEVRALAAETLREIEVFKHSQGSYGYVFFVLGRSQ